jgi:hypothetical protein
MARPRGQYNPISSLADEDNEEQFQDEPIDDTAAPTSSGGASRQRNYDRIASTEDDAPLKADDASGGLDQKEEEDIGERMTVVILDSAQTKFNVQANPDWTIGKFKKVGETVHKIPPLSQRLIYRGKLLADSNTLRECGIQDKVILHLFPKPRVVVTSSSTDTSSVAPAESMGGAHVPQIVLDEDEAERRGQILVLGSVEIAEAQNNVKLLSLLLLVVCSMRLLALFSIAMGVADDPSSEYQDDLVPNHDNDDDRGGNSTNGGGDGGGGYPSHDADYQTRPWETADYFDLVVSAIGFYVATLGMKATTENTLRVANNYLIGTFIAGVGWNLWNIFLYLLFVKDETGPKPDDDQTVSLDRDDFATVAFFTVVLPLLVWFLCCLRAHQFRQLLEEAEQEAAERIRSQLTVDDGGGGEVTGDGNGRELTEIIASSSSSPPSNRPMIV